MAVKCILTGQEKVNLSGDTMTGDLKVGSSSIGTNGYIEGTWLKTTKTTEKAGDFATIDGDGWLYKRKPADVLGDIGGQAKITANGILKGDGTGAITVADETEVELVDLPQEVFWATYGTTTGTEIEEAWQAGKAIYLKYSNKIFVFSYNYSDRTKYYFYNIDPGWPRWTCTCIMLYGGTWSITETGGIFDLTQTLVLPTSSWSGNDPYTQEVVLSAETANTKVDIQPSEELYDQLVADNVGYLAIKNVNGTLTAVAKGGKPSVDLTVQVTYNNVY